MLNMRSASGSSSTDLTARARILRAAIRRYASDGLKAPLRQIAADAGVSAGLIVHHFGSVAGLRSACDQHVIEETRAHKSEALSGGSAGPAAMLQELAQVEGYAPLIGYVLRRLQAGGELTNRFVDSFVADAVEYLHEAEEKGTVRPSRDPEARARVLTEQALGALLLQLPAQQEQLDLGELPTWLSLYTQRIIGPVLEYYTEPILTDSTLLDAYLANRTAATTTQKAEDHG